MFIKRLEFIKPLDKDSYLNNIPAVKFLIENRKLVFAKPITIFMGENGTGKSTLTEAIAVAARMPAEGGSNKWTYAYEDSHSELYQHIVLVRTGLWSNAFFLRAESFYTMTHFMLENEREVLMPIEHYTEMSHGESFLYMAFNRFRPNGLFILDEPESALSPKKQLILMKRINELTKQGCQFIIATHSPLLSCMPDSEVWEFNNYGILLSSYDKTSHFYIYKNFFQNPQKFIREYLNDL